MKELVRWHTDLVKNKPGLTSKTSISIETGTAYPISRPPYRLDAKRSALIKEAVLELLELGIVRLSQSPWASPAILVTKKDGAKRLCVDYRRLNAIPVSDPSPLPNINDLLDKLGTVSHYNPIYLRLCTDLAPSTKMRMAYRDSLGEQRRKAVQLNFQRRVRGGCRRASPRNRP